jgi:hypothetical protein
MFSCSAPQDKVIGRQQPGEINFGGPVHFRRSGEIRRPVRNRRPVPFDGPVLIRRTLQIQSPVTKRGGIAI